MGKVALSGVLTCLIIVAFMCTGGFAQTVCSNKFKNWVSEHPGIVNGPIGERVVLMRELFNKTKRWGCDPATLAYLNEVIHNMEDYIEGRISWYQYETNALNARMREQQAFKARQIGDIVKMQSQIPGIGNPVIRVPITPVMHIPHYSGSPRPVLKPTSDCMRDCENTGVSFGICLSQCGLFTKVRH